MSLLCGTQLHTHTCKVQTHMLSASLQMCKDNIPLRAVACRYVFLSEWQRFVFGKLSLCDPLSRHKWSSFVLCLLMFNGIQTLIYDVLCALIWQRPSSQQYDEHEIMQRDKARAKNVNKKHSSSNTNENRLHVGLWLILHIRISLFAVSMWFNQMLVKNCAFYLCQRRCIAMHEGTNIHWYKKIKTKTYVCTEFILSIDGKHLKCQLENCTSSFEAKLVGEQTRWMTHVNNCWKSNCVTFKTS